MILTFWSQEFNFEQETLPQKPVIKLVREEASLCGKIHIRVLSNNMSSMVLVTGLWNGGNLKIWFPFSLTTIFTSSVACSVGAAFPEAGQHLRKIPLFFNHFHS